MIGRGGKQVGKKEETEGGKEGEKTTPYLYEHENQDELRKPFTQTTERLAEPLAFTEIYDSRLGGGGNSSLFLRWSMAVTSKGVEAMLLPYTTLLAKNLPLFP